MDNIALNVVIGLVFIYLLYSLFATILSELFATHIGLRARTLKEAVDRMLNDEDEEEQRGFLSRFWDSFNLLKNPKNPRVTNFYNHPEIKYLGSTGIFKVPSQFRAGSFSKTLINLLNETGYKKANYDHNTKTPDPDKGDIKYLPVISITRERIDDALEGIIAEHKRTTGEEKRKIVLDEETAKYVFSLWKESYGDLTRFKLHLEIWFDRTMEQCTEWYKRKMQIILLVLGFMLAWLFHADTFTIVNKLSTDRDAREKLVTLAAAYRDANRQPPGEAGFTVSPGKVDSLLDVKKRLEADIANANSILGFGGWLPDSVDVTFDSAAGKRVYTPAVDVKSLSQAHQHAASGTLIFSRIEKWNYFFRVFLNHFWGFFVTAIAISLGAPFWFDLLNKLMALRTSTKQPTDTSTARGADHVSPLNRVG